jgi:hypothetical protein
VGSVPLTDRSARSGLCNRAVRCLLVVVSTCRRRPSSDKGSTQDTMRSALRLPGTSGMGRCLPKRSPHNHWRSPGARETYSLNHIRKRRYCREPDKGGGRLLLGAKWEGETRGAAHGPSYRRSRPYRLLDTSPRNSVLPRKPSHSKQKQVQFRARQTGGTISNWTMPEGPIRRPCTSDLSGPRRAREATRNAKIGECGICPNRSGPRMDAHGGMRTAGGGKEVL